MLKKDYLVVNLVVDMYNRGKHKVLLYQLLLCGNSNNIMCFNFFEWVVKLCTIKYCCTVRIILAAVPVSVPVPPDTKKVSTIVFFVVFQYRTGTVPVLIISILLSMNYVSVRSRLLRTYLYNIRKKRNKCILVIFNCKLI